MSCQTATINTYSFLPTKMFAFQPRTTGNLVRGPYTPGVTHTYPQVLEVRVRNEHEVNALHDIAQRFQQLRVEMDVPPAVQHDSYAADLRHEDSPLLPCWMSHRVSVQCSNYQV